MSSNGYALSVQSDVDVAQIQQFNSLLDQRTIVTLGDNLMGVHPQAQEIGKLGMRTVAQLALMTGANPLPGTNGIHAWRDKRGNLAVQFGIGYWRGRAEKAGGLLWIDRFRLMTKAEREAWHLLDAEIGIIGKAALKRDAFALLRAAREAGIEMTLAEAKEEVGRVGVGVADTRTYEHKGRTGYSEAKQGRPLTWTAEERAERDLLRKLVPITKADSERWREIPEASEQWGYPERTLGDGSGIDDSLDEINADLFGRPPDVPPPPEDAMDGDFEEMEEAPAENADPGIDAVVADLRASLEEVAKNGKVKVGLLCDRAVGAGLYKNNHHALQALKGWPEMPADYEPEFRHEWKLDNASEALAWLIARKVEAETGPTDEEE